MGLPVEDGRPPYGIAERVEEIALMTRLMVLATGRPGPLSQDEIDHLLANSPPAEPAERCPESVDGTPALWGRAGP